MMTTAGARIASAVAETVLPKVFRRGTHRIIEPSETLTRYRPLASSMGITRLGNITGLDRIGIPVVAAIRPNSRSVSVSQGKGLDLSQAMASALMEAIEGFHAEEVGESLCVTDVVDPLTSCTTGRRFDLDVPISWLEGFDLLQQEPCWLRPKLSTPITRGPSTAIFSPAPTGWRRAIIWSRRSALRCASWSSAMASRCGVHRAFAREPGGRSTSLPSMTLIASRC